MSSRPSTILGAADQAWLVVIDGVTRAPIEVLAIGALAEVRGAISRPPNVELGDLVSWGSVTEAERDALTAAGLIESAAKGLLSIVVMRHS